jgi:hypothetical protein
MEPVTGRRLRDVRFGDLPEEELQPGDYWKYLNDDGEVMSVSQKSNLTGTVWGYYSPDGNGIGTLLQHTVREHEDGTISVRPNDGSSNSILHRGGPSGKTWHGYVDHGVWSHVQQIQPKAFE